MSDHGNRLLDDVYSEVYYGKDNEVLGGTGECNGYYAEDLAVLFEFLGVKKVQRDGISWKQIHEVFGRDRLKFEQPKNGMEAPSSI